MIAGSLHQAWATCRLTTKAEAFCNRLHNCRRQFARERLRSKLVIARSELIQRKRLGQEVVRLARDGAEDEASLYFVVLNHEIPHKCVYLLYMQRTIDVLRDNRF